MDDAQLIAMRDQLVKQLEALRRTRVSVGTAHLEQLTADVKASLQRALDDIERLIEARKRRAAETGK